MADNIGVNTGSGTSIATDDVGGAQYQRIKVTDGTGDSSTHLKVSTSGAMATRPAEDSRASFIAQIRSALATNKHHLCLFNAGGSSVVIKIQRILVSQSSDAAVSGVVTSFKVIRVTGKGTGGSAITVNKMDTTDAGLNASVTAENNPTSPTEVSGSYFSEISCSSEETAVQDDPKTLWDGSDAVNLRPLTLRAGEGITIKQGNFGAAGTVSVMVFFTQE